MATDAYGNDIGVGDRVTKVGYSDVFVIIAVVYGGDMVKLRGPNWEEGPVNSNSVIKTG